MSERITQTNTNLSERINTTNDDLSMLSNNLDGKADKSGATTITVKKDSSLNPNAYASANIVVSSNTAGGYAAIGFHRPGTEAGMIFLKGGTLQLLLNTGELYQLDMHKLS